MRKLLGRVLADVTEFEVYFARAMEQESIGATRHGQPDVITLDIHMPEMDGLACLDRIMIERPCPVLMVSSLTAEGADITLEAFRLGAVDFVSSPKALFRSTWRSLVRFYRQNPCRRGRKAQSKPQAAGRVQHRIGGSAPLRQHMRGSGERRCERPEMALWLSESPPAAPRRSRRC